MASVSLHCKSRHFNKANVTIYLQILSTDASFHLYDRPTSDSALNLRIPTLQATL